MKYGTDLGNGVVVWRESHRWIDGKHYSWTYIDEYKQAEAQSSQGPQREVDLEVSQSGHLCSRQALLRVLSLTQEPLAGPPPDPRKWWHSRKQ